MKLLPALLVALLLLVNLQACSFRSERLPKLSGRKLGSEESALLLENLSKRSKEILSFRMLTRSTVSAAQQKSSIRHALVFETPAKLRIEALPLNSAYSLGLFLLNGEQASFFDPVKKKVSLSTANGNQLRRLLGVPIKELDLPYFLVARIPQELIERLKSASNTEIYFDPAKQAYLIVLGKFEYFLEIDSGSLLIKSLEIRDALNTRLSSQVQYAEPHGSGAGAYYGYVNLIFPNEHASAQLRINSMALNKPLPAHLFELKIPQDYTVEQDRETVSGL